MDTATETPRRGIDVFIEGEYRELQRILSDVDFLVERRSFVTAAKRFGEFRWALERHLEDEEGMLFPLFVKATGGVGDVVSQLHAEHRRLLLGVETVARSLARWDHGGCCTAVDELLLLLERHHRNEAKMLHPALDRVLSTEADWRLLCWKRRRP